jgi:DNA mismatch repair protein MutS
VAALAGIPKSVTSQARRYLTELERERDALRTQFSPQAELPLFALPQEPVPPAPSQALEALRALDPNALSPREALDWLYRLQQMDRDS